MSPPHKGAGDVLTDWLSQLFLCLPVFCCYILPLAQPLSQVAELGGVKTYLQWGKIKTDIF